MSASKPSEPFAWEYAVACAIALGLIMATLIQRSPPPAPAAPDPRLAVAQRLRQDNRRPEALVELGAVLATAPQDQQALFLAGQILGEMQQYDAAAVRYQQSLEIANDLPTLLARGLLELERNAPEAAVPWFRTATELDPNQAVGFLDLGIALLRAGDPAGAIAPLERAVELAPDNPYTRHNLGYALRLAHRPADALIVLQAAVDHSPGLVASWYELAVAHLELGQVDAAAAAFGAVLERDPGHGAARAALEQLERPEQLGR